MSDILCPYSCCYKTPFGYCGKTSGTDGCERFQYGGKTFNEVLSEALKNFDKKTNADKIRDMSDEELAAFLMGVSFYGGVETGGRIMNWLDWLKEEVEE